MCVVNGVVLIYRAIKCNQKISYKLNKVNDKVIILFNTETEIKFVNTNKNLKVEIIEDKKFVIILVKDLSKQIKI